MRAKSDALTDHRFGGKHLKTESSDISLLTPSRKESIDDAVTDYNRSNMLNEIKSSLDNYLKSESANDSHMDDWSILSEQQLKELEL